jgi:hypothetical protein
MMKNFMISLMLAMLSGVAFISSNWASEPTSPAPRPIHREIRELHDEVRVLRRDVTRLIELLQNSPSEKSRLPPGSDNQLSTEDHAKPVSDDFVWMRVGIRVKPVAHKLDLYRG